MRGRAPFRIAFVGSFLNSAGSVTALAGYYRAALRAGVEALKRGLALGIAPEGTRHHVTEWKRGFYHIAKSAGIPIVIAVVDGKHKEVRIGQVFHPTEDVEADMKAIQGYFTGVVGINPRRKYITLQS